MIEQNAPLRWLILCKVIDNFGDAGVTWRLARQLATEYGAEVEYWIDDPQKAGMLGAHSFTAAQGAVELRHWDDALEGNASHTFAGRGLGAADVVIAAFACTTPESVLEAMQQQIRQTGRTPVWLNLEYLSAEDWVENSHLLRSPKQGLSETFYFPGWFAQTGGLLRESDLPNAISGLPRSAPALRQQRQQLIELLSLPASSAATTPSGPVPFVDACWISLFCYPQAPVIDLVTQLRQSGRPTLLLVPEGVANKSLEQLELFAHPRAPGDAKSASAWFCLGCVTIARIPFVGQDDYDRLLCACDLNFVRGEDSLVRAIWAAKPFVWNIYPQEESAHEPKLAAFLDRVLCAPSTDTSAALRELTLWWNANGNGLPGSSVKGGKRPPKEPGAAAKALLLAELEHPDQASEWQKFSRQLADGLATQTDLCSRLLNFAAATRRDDAVRRRVG